MTREEIDYIFNTNESVKVVFIKADNSVRTMICTVKNIPEDKKPKGDSKRLDSPSVKTVFDTEINEWRKFKIDSVISCVGI